MGDGNIDEDPLFVDPDNGNFHLQADSPCRGAGQDGVDMGAYPMGIAQYDWFVQLSASVADAHDASNYAGAAEDARDGFDEDFDIPEPPHAPEDYISLYFPHEEWDLGEDFVNFMTDIRSPDVINHDDEVWEFEVDTDIAEEDVTLEFTLDGIPDEQHIFLRDVDAEENIDLRDNDFTHTYNSGDGGVRNFELHLGSGQLQVTVTSLGDGDTLEVDEVFEITWEVEGFVEFVDLSEIFYRLHDDDDWRPIDEIDNEELSYEWEVPDTYSPYCKILVVCTDAVGNHGSDVSDGYFMITPTESEFEFGAGWSLMSIPLNPESHNPEALIQYTKAATVIAPRLPYFVKNKGTSMDCSKFRC